MESENANLQEIRLKIRNKKGLYKIAQSRHIFLPKYSSKCITKEYLLNLLKSNIFYLKSESVSHAVLGDQTIKKEQLFEQFCIALKIIDQSVKSGFDKKHQPDFQYLLNIYYFLCPTNKIFFGNFIQKNQGKVDFIKESDLRAIAIQKSKKISIFPEEEEQKLQKMEIHSNKLLKKIELYKKKLSETLIMIQKKKNYLNIQENSRNLFDLQSFLEKLQILRQQN